ncbi:MAG: M16 family metallopeptidase [Acidimicrobiia bacterium]
MAATVIAVVAARVAAAVAVAVAAAAVVGDGLIRITTLPSGMRVVTEQMSASASVSLGVWVGVGSRDEPDHHAGVSHFLEHLLFKGTEHRSSRELAAAIDRVGGEMNAFTTKEYTAYYCRVPADALDIAMDVVADVLTAPALRDHDIDAERSVILEELSMDDDTPDDRVHGLLAQSLFPGHPLGRDTAGTRETVAAIAPDDVRGFFRRWYTPGNFVVSAAGAVDHDAVVADVIRRFESLTAAATPARSAPAGAIEPFAMLKRPVEQAHVALGYRAMARTDDDREALDVVNQVLGGGPSSRLFEEVREQRGLAYAVYSGPAAYGDAGAFTVYAATAAEQLEELLRVIDGELDRLRRDGVTEDERDVAVGYLAGSYVLGLEDSGSRMARNGSHLVCLGRILPVDEQVRRYKAVDDVAMRRAVERVLTGPRSMAIVGPIGERALRKRVAAFAR